MILTVTYKGSDTQDLGYLLHKNPYRPQSFDLPMGKAHILYPEISDTKTTAAMILELDPLLLSKGKPGTGGSGLFDYVNDRPYVASSFLCSAMSRCFGTAMAGRCDQRQELADTELDLEIALCCLPVRGDKDLIHRFFDPLGYAVSFKTFLIDERFPEWGESPYVDLELSAHKKLSDVLNQIYVLVPVFDLQMHYYVSEAEIDNLLKHGKGWLGEHPERETIIRRYFSMAKSYAETALLRLGENNADGGTDEDGPLGTGQCVTADGGPDEAEERTAKKDHPATLDQLRLQAVKDAVLSSGARSVIDIGCGEGKLIALLAREAQIERLAGTDVSPAALKKAAQRLERTGLSGRQREKVTWFQGSILYRDQRFLGFDAACAAEVVEHIDPEKIPAFEEILFRKTAPKTVILTTPNRSYNALYGMGSGEFRHPDHRFEWTEEEFRNWCGHICARFGYTVELRGIGERNGIGGYPTLMGVFSK